MAKESPEMGTPEIANKNDKLSKQTHQFQRPSKLTLWNLRHFLNLVDNFFYLELLLSHWVFTQSMRDWVGDKIVWMIRLGDLNTGLVNVKTS